MVGAVETVAVTRMLLALESALEEGMGALDTMLAIQPSEQPSSHPGAAAGSGPESVGAPRPAVTESKPIWDRERGRLELGGVLVRKVSRRGKNIRKVLDAFQDQGWPQCIGNPLLEKHAKSMDLATFHETLKTLNKTLKAIKFSGDGFGGIVWRENVPRGLPEEPPWPCGQYLGGM